MARSHRYNLRKRRDPLLNYWARLPDDLLPSIFVLALVRLGAINIDVTSHGAFIHHHWGCQYHGLVATVNRTVLHQSTHPLSAEIVAVP